MSILPHQTAPHHLPCICTTRFYGHARLTRRPDLLPTTAQASRCTSMRHPPFLAVGCQGICTRLPPPGAAVAETVLLEDGSS